MEQVKRWKNGETKKEETNDGRVSTPRLLAEVYVKAASRTVMFLDGMKKE
jgi:hypothetical protein